MLVWLLDVMLGHWPDGAAGLSKITLRAALAAALSFALAVALGGRSIAWLKARFREPIKSGSPEVERLHKAKRLTPTMGGIFIIATLVLAVLACGDWSNAYLPIVLLTGLAFAALGAVDDVVKLRTAARGLRPRTKLVAQTAIALVAALLIFRVHEAAGVDLSLRFPLVGWHVDLGWLFVPLAAVVVVGSSNAVNLADGLDGLAGGCLVCATGALAAVVYAAGHASWAGYLGIAHVAGAGEMLVVAAAMIGSLLGFLWFNCHPASVFMGDTGSLPLGGLLGLLAVIARQELLLAVIGGVFVVEALSVIVQVASFRLLGMRVFRCAPLHHHFQLTGWPEDKIVVRFWIAAALCALAGLAALKSPGGPPSEVRWAATSRQLR